MKLTILILCFNEVALISKTIEQAKLINIDKEIVVIDNCSTDGTREILKAFEKDGGIRIILHDKNMGVGYSACEGIQLARGDYIYAPGADLEYKMEDVYKMFEKIEAEKLDGVFGSRLLDKKDVSRIKLIKERPYWLGSFIGTFLTNLFYGRNFTDIIATKLIRSDILKNLGCQATSQAFEFELVNRICKNGYRIGEVPVWYKPRSHKEGKTIREFDMILAIWEMLKVKIFVKKDQDRQDQNKKANLCPKQ